MNNPPLYKTTIVIWTEFDANGAGLETLAYHANEGDGYCSRQDVAYVERPEDDPDWDGTEFFLVGDDDYAAVGTCGNCQLNRQLNSEGICGACEEVLE